jgi:hypothetical protein
VCEATHDTANEFSRVAARYHELGTVTDIEQALCDSADVPATFVEHGGVSRVASG